MKESEMELFRNLVGDQQPGEVPRSEPDSDPYKAAASSVPPASVGGTSQASSLRPSTRNRTKEASKTAGTKFILNPVKFIFCSLVFFLVHLAA